MTTGQQEDLRALREAAERIVTLLETLVQALAVPR